MRATLCYRWLLTFGVLPLVMLCAQGGRASASCGDYLHIVADTSPAPAGDAPRQPRPPCHGPSCQKPPATPSPAPVTVTAPDTQTSDALLAADMVVDTPSSADLPPPESPTSFGLAEAIFHPPRHS